jgi:hypothetical protein
MNLWSFLCGAAGSNSLDACRAQKLQFLPIAAGLAQFGLQISDILIQYDSQKGCRPRGLCNGDADGRSTFEEYTTAAVSPLYDDVPPPWLLEIISSNLDGFFKSFIMV